MMWTKFHAKLPTAGTFAVYASLLGMLTAIESSCRMEWKKYVWLTFGLLILAGIPLGSTTLHYGLERLCSFEELQFVCKRLGKKGLVLDRSALTWLIGNISVTFVYVLVAAKPQGWHSQDDWQEEILLPVLVEVFVIVLACSVIACLRNRPLQEEEELVLSDADIDFKQKVSRWQVVSIGLTLQWIVFGLDGALQGFRNPLKNNMGYAIMEWHFRGAVLYYIYLWSGLLYFKMIELRNWTFVRCMCYSASMILCSLVGAFFFVDSSYEPNAALKRYAIPCKDDSVCKKSFNHTLLGDYPCGERDGKRICLIGSLDYNMGCSRMTGIDGHSLWHFFSAMGLFLFTMSIMVMDDLLANTDRRAMAVL